MLIDNCINKSFKRFYHASSMLQLHLLVHPIHVDPSILFFSFRHVLIFIMGTTVNFFLQVLHNHLGFLFVL